MAAATTTLHPSLLGTTLKVVTWPARFSSPAIVDACVVAEVRRLMAVFDVYDQGSELRRHRAGEPAGPELLVVEGLAARWRSRTGGAFNPSVETLRQLWLQAEAQGRPPSDARLAAEVADMTAAPFDNLNAIAKGWIVDRAVDRARELRRAPRSLLVEAGGDLLHRGAGAHRVGIENPFRPYDNEPPIATVEVSNQAVATSGSSRRFFRVGGARYGHVIDPRTGRPVDTIVSVTVIAADAATADVLATAVMVLGVDEGLRLIESEPEAACFIIDRDGERTLSRQWPAASGVAD